MLYIATRTNKVSIIIVNMNIVQAYTKFNNQNIILISGFSGSHKTKIAKFVSDLFGFQIISLTKFFKPDPDYDIEENYVTLKDDTKVLNWDDIHKSIDWDKLNEFVNSNKTIGIVIHGFGFPTSLLRFTPDFHIHLSISKQKLMENRNNFIEKHSADAVDRTKIDNGENSLSPIEKMFFNTVTYPIYMSLKTESKIDKYLNTNELSEDQMKDQIFDYLIKTIEHKLNQVNKNKTYGSSTSLPESSKLSISTTGLTQRSATLPSHYEDKDDIIDEFYYPGAKKKLYDFNDEGIDYPDDYIKKHRPDEPSSSDSSDSPDSDRIASSKKKINNDSSSSSSDEAVFIATVDETDHT